MNSTGSMALVAPAFNVAAPGDLTLLWTTLPVIGAILLGALIIACAKRWRQKEESVQYTSSDELAHFRALYEQGELNAEEFQRIQNLLNERLKKEMNVAAKAAPADAAPAASAEQSPSAVSPAAIPESNGQPPVKPGPDHLA